MLRRIFLFQILLGWLIVVIKKGLEAMQPLMKESPKTALHKEVIAKPALTAPLFAHAEPINLYVALNGNDSWTGRLETANQFNNDGPLATIKKAKTVVRELKLQHSDRPIKISLRGGTYFLSAPIVFEPEDSGSINQLITYRSYPKELATISGGKLITGWQKETVNKIEMWTVKLPQDTETKWQFQHLWVNGKRRSRSRYPNQGYLKVKTVDLKPGQTWSQGNSSFEYYQGNLPDPNAAAFKGAELIVMTRWVESRLPVVKIDPTQRQIYFSKNSVFQLAPGDLYYLENSLKWLNTPGEWYLDRLQAKLYYLPLSEEGIDTVEIIAPILDSLLIFPGNAAENRYIQHLKFEQLAFSHTDWQLPAYISGYNQNAWEVPGAVKAIAIRNCTWNNCTFSHLGNYALELGKDCQYSRISCCSLFDLGAGGIKIGDKHSNNFDLNTAEVTHHNQIINNHLYAGGKFFHSAAAIVVWKSHHNLIAGNQIYDYYYTGIAVMGDWSFQPTQSYQNLITDNHIHHIGKLSNGDGPIMSDMGGIYILGCQEGTKICHNQIHDINALRYGGWGIYLDEGSSYIVAEYNLVYSTSHSGFAQHYGKENLIRHNIFAFGKESQIHRHRQDLQTAREQNFISFRFENNIVYWQSGQLFTGLDKDYQSHAVFQRNIYWQTDKSSFLFGNLSWQQWQKSDRYSLIIDPLFVAPQEDNFKLQPNSPAYKILPAASLAELEK